MVLIQQELIHAVKNPRPKLLDHTLAEAVHVPPQLDEEPAPEGESEEQHLALRLARIRCYAPKLEIGIGCTRVYIVEIAEEREAHEGHRGRWW
jgi:hypothetical protein